LVHAEQVVRATGFQKRPRLAGFEAPIEMLSPLPLDPCGGIALHDAMPSRPVSFTSDATRGKQELENYRRISFLLDLMHSKARRSVKKRRTMR
jgi:hypothetical protein